MPTIKKPVHVFVDEMAVKNGPPAEPLNVLYNTAAIGFGHDWSERTFKMTLTTSASSREFVRKVTIVEIEPEYEDWLIALNAGRDPFDGPMMTGSYVIKGFIGDWYFTGTYDPKTRKGSLKEDEYDPELEHEREVQDAMSDYMLMQHGY